jgi:hypothetical protein
MGIAKEGKKSGVKTEGINSESGIPLILNIDFILLRLSRRR